MLPVVMVLLDVEFFARPPSDVSCWGRASSLEGLQMDLNLLNKSSSMNVSYRNSISRDEQEGRVVW